MRGRTTALVLMLLAAFLIPAGAGARSTAKAVAKPAAKAAPSKKASASVKKKAAPKKERKEAAPEQAKAPVPLPPVSQAVIDALATGDLASALVVMREEPDTPRLKHLMNQSTRAALFDIKKSPDRSEAHKAYQNVAVSYHNLYLFLKRHGIDQKRYFSEAKRYYGKARGTGTVLHKAECDVLLAALLASTGEREKAEKAFGKIDASLLRSDFESTEYLAAYHAAAGQTEEAIEALETAHRIDPDRTLAWVALGDDFAGLESDPRYTGLIESWYTKARDRGEFQLSVPRTKGAPKLEMASPSMPFAPQKMMKHASPKEAAAVSQKKGSKSTSHSKAAVKKSSSSKKKKPTAKKTKTKK